MSLLNPLALLWLWVLPLVVLLYFLKLKRPRQAVPSTLLWQKMLEDLRVNAPFQKLRRSLLLLVQLLALALLVAALARPVFRVRESADESLVVLLDTSASMQAKDDEGMTRLDRAREEIVPLIDHLGRHGEMTLIAFNTKPAVLCGFTGNRRELRRVLDAVVPSDCPTRVEGVLSLVESICVTRTHPRVILFSDGAFPSVQARLPVPIEFRRIGETLPNVALTGLDIRRSLGDRRTVEMFVAIENFGSEPIAGSVGLTLDGRPADSRPFSVGAGETLSQIFEARMEGGGLVELSLDTSDALACDNRAWRVVPPPAVHRVWLAGEQLFFIERVLKSAPWVAYAPLPSGNPTDSVAAGDTVIWNAVAKPGVAGAHNIYLGCSPAVGGLERGGAVEWPTVLDWDRSHPVNRFLDFDNLEIKSAFRLTLPDGAQVVLRGAGLPLAAVLPELGNGSVVTTFDPLQSNWPLMVSFPIFLNNCLAYFDDLRARQQQQNIRVGEAIRLPVGAGGATVTTPDGRRVTMRVAGGAATYADVDRCGLYHVAGEGMEASVVAVNLFARDESRLSVVEQPVLPGTEVKAVPARTLSPREIWYPLVLALFLLLVAEWALYERRWFT